MGDFNHSTDATSVNNKLLSSQNICKQNVEEKPCESTLCTSVPLPHLQSTSTLNTDSSGNERSTWSRQLDFFLSCVGYAVGLGNIWRFPYLCYKSGGGAFLIPYFFFLIVCGVPLFFLEMSLGQFGSLGPISIWKISPIFKGLGYGMAIVSAVACIYYNVIIAWAIYYIYQSYSVSWSSCKNTWNTPNCISQINTNVESVFFNSSEIMNVDDRNSSGINFTEISNVTSVSSLINGSRMTASEEFWLFNVLHQSSGIDIVGEFQWPLVLSLFIAWVLIFLCVLKGIKSSGKVVYVTATFPYLVLMCLLVRGLTLPGAWEGITYYLKPQWRRLLTFEVWGYAATQIFYSVGAGWGALLTMASYNKFSNNVYRDSIVVPIINCATSVLAGFVVFSVIGFMAHETGKSVEDVVKQGPGLAFIVYPHAISLLPFPEVWAYLFFFMVFAVGLDTQFGMFETAISAFMDEFPVLRKRKTLFVALFCCLLFLLGLPCVTQGGMYVVQLMDFYCAAFSLMVISLLETIAVSWVYGIDRFLLDISLMTKRVPSLWWKLCWSYITPFTILALLLFIVINHTSITYNDYIYPSWSIGLGWVIAMCSIAPIPTIAIMKLFKTRGTWKQKILRNLRPSPEWGPALEENRMLYRKSLSAVPTNFKLSQTDVNIECADVHVSPDEMNEMLPTEGNTSL